MRSFTACVLDQLEVTLGGAEASEPHVDEGEVRIAVGACELELKRVDIGLRLMGEFEGFSVLAHQCEGVGE